MKNKCVTYWSNRKILKEHKSQIVIVGFWGVVYWVKSESYNILQTYKFCICVKCMEAQTTTYICLLSNTVFFEVGHAYFEDFQQIPGYLTHASWQLSYNCLTFSSRKPWITNACYYILSPMCAFDDPTTGRQKYTANILPWAILLDLYIIFFVWKSTKSENTIILCLHHTKSYSLCCLATAKVTFISRHQI